jgi:hypothetical protein
VSGASASVTPATIPDAPTSVTATATNGEATVSFTAPSSNGGSAITYYTATSSPGNIAETLNQSGSGDITVSGLTNGVAYTFTVTATNAKGTSAASAASTSVTPATMPDAPTGVSAIAENTQATVSFTAPSNDGGSAITQYTATSNPGGFTGTLSQAESGAITVTGLTNGVAYTFTVMATNAKGTSAASAASTSVTPATIPDAPTGITAIAENTQAIVSFTAPSSNGGSAITQYTATSNPGGITETLSQSGSGAITLTGLTNGTAYTFTVTATNAVGTSAASAASTSVTPATTPNAPTSVNATAENTQATVSFTAPSNDGGSAITSYTATSNPGGFTETLNQSGSGVMTVTGLTNGEAYTFTVTATNAKGTSSASAASTSVTPATTPDAPTDVNAIAGNTQATVSFIAPSSDGGSVITSYRATSSPGNITGTLIQAGSDAIIVRGLTNNEAYSFTVTATNVLGTSVASAASNIVTPATIPDAPTGVSATVGDTQATVSFTAPSNDGGSVITSYTATSSPEGITETLNQSGSGTIVVSGLSNGTSYTFSVTATNAIGTSISSATSNSDTQPITIGDTLEGGIVFYLDGSGGGKVCAATDQSAGIKWALPAYQSISVPSPGATSSTNGAANTDAIIAQTGQPAANTYAAGLCRTYDGGGFNDWYLPARNELDLMHDNLHVSGLGGFSSSWYWSSREFSTTHGYFQSFSSGSINGVNKNTSTLKVRAVRAFSGTLTIPDSPTAVNAAATNGEANVSFTAPSNDGGSAITSYTVTSSPGAITGTLSQAGSGAIKVRGLTNGTAYTFTVTATNAIGTSVASTVSNQVTPQGVPDETTRVYATAGNTQATVFFAAPSNDGGSAITSYTATSSIGGITETLSQAGSGAITVTGLTNGTAYSFTVTATNAIGTSVASAASTLVTPATIPDAPTGVTATAGNTEATVSFTAPSSDGGSVITSYTATSNPGNITGTLSQAGSGAITVIGLTNGVDYSFTVTATNAFGTSVASAASTLVTPQQGAPNAPTGITAIAGNTQATVSFTAPSNDGGSAITSYTATSSPGNNTGILNQAGSGPITVSGLTNGVQYSFTVRANNASGTSISSAASTLVTPGTRPNAPTGVSATAGNRQATVSFTAPSNGGDSAITSYTATSNPGGFTGALSQAGSGTITVSGLTNGVQYSFTVTATNATGTSVASDASILVTPQGAPGFPRVVSVAAGNTQATVSFTAPSNDGGSAITSYTATSNPGNITETLNQSGSGAITVTGLTNGVRYYFRVTATNALGTSGGFLSNYVTPGTIPDAPTGVTAIAGNTQATVSFTAPSNGGDSTITSYMATSSPGGFTGTLNQAGSGAITVRGLTNGLQYSFTVTATNATGTSVASAASNIVTHATTPGAPTGVTAIAGNTQATVSFTAPSNDGGSPITQYKVTSSPGGFTGTLNQAGSGAIIVRGLTNDTAYTFTVTATNAVGTSAASAASNSVTPDNFAVIGDLRAGGVVFWIDPSDNRHGLVCAIEDQSAGIRWYNGAYTATGATGTGIGTGSANTTTIIANQGATETSYAAGVAGAYSGGGHTDWFLPSKDELDQMYQNKATINSTATENNGSNFTGDFYWSSTEYDSYGAWFRSFYYGSKASSHKVNAGSVRVVRAF